MPTIDYRQLRKRVSMEQVLELAAFVASAHSGSQVRGPCPVHRGSSSKSRTFSANYAKNTFQCLNCGAKGMVTEEVEVETTRTGRRRKLTASQ